jgi:2-hydroxycyclohexanecarboxyl-CoA dehydrogenase
MMNFTGKVAIVTGGGGGIGRAIVLKMANLGAKVAIVDLNEENGKNVENEVKSLKSESEAIFVKTDITDFKQATEMAKTVFNHFGKIDVLINNAAWDKIQLFMETSPELWDKLIDVNLKGPIYVTRAVLEYMIKAEEGGSIVNVLSDAAKVGSTGEGVYSAAKGGMYSFTKSMARELARYKIRVNSTCPGPTDTPLLDQVKETMPKVVAAIEKSVPLRRIARPEEQANAVVWLASDEASYITGQALSVNGGLNMC